MARQAKAGGMELKSNVARWSVDEVDEPWAAMIHGGALGSHSSRSLAGSPSGFVSALMRPSSRPAPREARHRIGSGVPALGKTSAP